MIIKIRNVRNILCIFLEVCKEEKEFFLYNNIVVCFLLWGDIIGMVMKFISK